MFSDDFAEACVFLMEKYEDPQLINVGTGEEVSILQLAKLIAEVVGYEGKIVFDASKPDGTPRKVMDSSRLHRLGYKHRVSLREGVALMYEDYMKRCVEYARG